MSFKMASIMSRMRQIELGGVGKLKTCGERLWGYFYLRRPPCHSKWRRKCRQCVKSSGVALERLKLVEKDCRAIFTCDALHVFQDGVDNVANAPNRVGWRWKA